MNAATEAICQLRAAGYSKTAIAKTFGVDRSTITKVLTGGTLPPPTLHRAYKRQARILEAPAVISSDVLCLGCSLMRSRVIEFQQACAQRGHGTITAEEWRLTHE